MNDPDYGDNESQDSQGQELWISQNNQEEEEEDGDEDDEWRNVYKSTLRYSQNEDEQGNEQNSFVQVEVAEDGLTSEQNNTKQHGESVIVVISQEEADEMEVNEIPIYKNPMTGAITAEMQIYQKNPSEQVDIEDKQIQNGKQLNNENEKQIYQQQQQQQQPQSQQQQQQQFQQQQQKLKSINIYRNNNAQPHAGTKQQPRKYVSNLVRMYENGMEQIFQKEQRDKKLREQRENMDLSYSLFGCLERENYLDIAAKTQIFMRKKEILGKIAEGTSVIEDAKKCTFKPKIIRSYYQISDKSHLSVYERSIQWQKKVEEKNEKRFMETTQSLESFSLKSKIEKSAETAGTENQSRRKSPGFDKKNQQENTQDTFNSIKKAAPTFFANLTKKIHSSNKNSLNCQKAATPNEQHDSQKEQISFSQQSKNIKIKAQTATQQVKLYPSSQFEPIINKAISNNQDSKERISSKQTKEVVLSQKQQLMKQALAINKEIKTFNMH